jgi:hypothetical protein
LEKGYQALRENSVPMNKHELEDLRDYKDELMFLMKRIQNHPSNSNYQVKITVGASESELRLDMNVPEESTSPTMEKGRST